MKKSKPKFATIRQAERIAKGKIRNGSFRWLQAAAEDGFTHEQNLKDLNNLESFLNTWHK